MKSTKTCLLLLLLFCSGNLLFCQPGESDKKYNIHEIKLYDAEDGTRAGAIAWNTALPDSVQKFVIRNLGIMEPVQVLLQTLSPNDEVTLQFVKEKWSEPESSISAKGKTIGKKIFRTYKTAAMKISAKKAGIPYMILVQVGKKLPVNSSPMFEIFSDENEYNEYLNNKGQTSELKTDSDIAVTPVTNNTNSGGGSSSNSSLLYIIIGLLALMVVLLGYFIFVKKGSKKILFMILLSGLGFNSAIAQSSDGSGPVDFGALLVSKAEFNALVNEFRSSNDAQYRGIDDNYRLIDQNRDKIQMIEGWAEENFALLARNWEGQENFNEAISTALDDLANQFNQFRNNFIDLEGNLNEINSKLSSLEAQVEFLSARDRDYAPDDEKNLEVLGLTLGCNSEEEYETALQCVMAFYHRIHDLEEKFRELNRIMKHNNWVVETGIASGNANANSAPGMGLGWQKQLAGTREAQLKLYRTYTDKYNEFEGRGENIIQRLENCIGGERCGLFSEDEWVTSTDNHSSAEPPDISVVISNYFYQRLDMVAPRLVPVTY